MNYQVTPLLQTLLSRDPAKQAERTRLLIKLAIALISLGLGGILDGLYWSAPEITPEEVRFGWNEPLARVEAPRIAALTPAFAVTDADGHVVSGAGRNAELWKFVKVVNSGRHLPTWKQESGDCVSMGWSNAIAYRQAVQIASEHRQEVLKIPFPPYMYGISRVQIGKRQLGRGAGSTGAWAAQGSQSYGVYPLEQATAAGYAYSGSLADQWGRQGPPPRAVEFASRYRIRTVSQVRSWEDVRDAVVHGYPVTVASNIGFEGGYYDEDGKRWLRPSGRWAHQMCIVGVEDRPAHTKGAYVLNSWGEDAHPRPLNDEPRGGFWVEWPTIQRMVAQNDSWAYSDFDGFPAENSIDWNIFREEEIQAGNQAVISAAEGPAVTEVIRETRKMSAFWIGCTLGGVGVLMMCGVLSRRRRGLQRAATCLLTVSLLASALTAEAGPRARARRFAAWQTYQACPVATWQAVPTWPARPWTSPPANRVPQSPPSGVPVATETLAGRQPGGTAPRPPGVPSVPEMGSASLFSNPMSLESPRLVASHVPVSDPFQNPMAVTEPPPASPTRGRRQVCTPEGCRWIHW